MSVSGATSNNGAVIRGPLDDAWVRWPGEKRFLKIFIVPENDRKVKTVTMSPNGNTVALITLNGNVSIIRRPCAGYPMTPSFPFSVDNDNRKGRPEIAWKISFSSNKTVMVLSSRCKLIMIKAFIEEYEDQRGGRVNGLDLSRIMANAPPRLLNSHICAPLCCLRVDNDSLLELRTICKLYDDKNLTDIDIELLDAVGSLAVVRKDDNVCICDTTETGLLRTHYTELANTGSFNFALFMDNARCVTVVFDHEVKLFSTYFGSNFYKKTFPEMIKDVCQVGVGILVMFENGKTYETGPIFQTSASAMTLDA